MRLRIHFHKTAAMRYTGHLDLHRAWERTFRRAGLPLAYSQGYNPHPRLNLAAALPLGFTSENEIIDAWLESELTTIEVETSLQRALPPGILVTHLEIVEERLPAMQTEVEACDYRITFLEPVPDLEKRIQDLLQAESLPRRRRNRDYDLRPLVLELQIIAPDPAGCQQLRARLSAREGATGRPEELVEVLGANSDAIRVHRLRLISRPS